MRRHRPAFPIPFEGAAPWERPYYVSLAAVDANWNESSCSEVAFAPARPNPPGDMVHRACGPSL